MERQLATHAAARFGAPRRVEAVDGASATFSAEQYARFAGADYLRDAAMSQRFGMRTVRRFIANQLTHEAVWRAVAADAAAEYAVVAQDDLALAPDAAARFDALLADVDALAARGGGAPGDGGGAPWLVWLAMPAFWTVPGLEPVTTRFDTSDGAGGVASASYAAPLAFDDRTAPPPGAREITRLGACERARGCRPCSTAYLLSRAGARALLAEADARGFDRVTDEWMDAFLARRGRHLIATPLIGTVDPSLGSDIFTIGESAARVEEREARLRDEAPSASREAEFATASTPASSPAASPPPAPPTSFTHVVRLNYGQQVWLNPMTVDARLTPEANVARWAAADAGFPNDELSAAVFARGVHDAREAHAAQRRDACARARAWEAVPPAATNGAAAASGARAADARRGDAPMLRPVRGARDARGNLAQLAALLRELELAARPAAWALVGVGDGAGAAALLALSAATDSASFVAGWAGPTVHCVDAWDEWWEDGEFRRRGHAAARAAVAPFAARAAVHEVPPVEGAARFARASLSFAYLNASRGFGELSAELAAWWPAVRVGGVIAGSDYFNGFVPALGRSLGVRDAVDVFFGSAGADHRVYSTSEQDVDSGALPIWFVLKCAE